MGIQCTSCNKELLPLQSSEIMYGTKICDGCGCSNDIPQECREIMAHILDRVENLEASK